MTNTSNYNGIVVIFDIDGTILNTMPKMRADINGAFSRLGHIVTDDQISAQKGWYGLATQLGISNEAYDHEFDKRKSWEQSLRDGEAPLFEDALPCLEALLSGGATLAALTKSLPEYTQAKLDYHHLNRYFGDRVAVTDIKSPSKSVEALSLVRQIGIPSIQKAYFIGDRTEDVTVSAEVYQKLYVPSNGVYINRERKLIPQEVSLYPVITSLNELLGVIANDIRR